VFDPPDVSNPEGEKMSLANLTVSGAARSLMQFPSPAEPSTGTGSSPDKARPFATAKSRPQNRFPIWGAGVGVGLALAVAYVTVPALYFVRTDDAYVQADTVSVVPKVAGYVTALHVSDNSHFTASELLVEIDARDFEVAVKSAEANLLSAQAAKANVLQQLTEQAHVVEAAQATVDSDRAILQFSRQQLDRYTDLATRGAGTEQRQQEAVSDIGQKKAALEHDIAAFAAAQAQIGVLKSQVQQADASIALQEAGLAQTKLNLSYTKIHAPADGSVANKTVQVGNFVQPGQTLFAAIPADAYIIANFKETQLEHMQVGQRVRVHIDAFPNERVVGHIDSFQRGTGSNFALLPPENATGNFIKVVQRIPVKIVVDGPADALHSISPGMSVEPTVTIAPCPSWLRPVLSLLGYSAD
jgi:membrane fusion protein (multidrug efflux system)